ncbi:MAG: DUF2092 domain-containing protein [Terrimicrobiaceae bacterium]|nr:DUF2092 domain-containing protein [Terrimicrobiaceae bacterium]
MKPAPVTSLLTLALLAAALAPAAAAAEQTGDQLLRRMSATLAAAHTFHFTATREIDAALLGGRDVPEKARIDALVQRPNRFAARSVSKDGVRRFIADGRTLTLFESRTNFYATTPMPATLDLLVARLDEKYGFTPPLAEFALSDPYEDFRRDADTIVLLGRTTLGAGFLGLGGVACDHLALQGKVADAELWIGVKDHLPRQLVATFKNLPGKPQLRVVFLRWDLDAKATLADFTFTLPKGATKIEMWTTAKMQAASKP